VRRTFRVAIRYEHSSSDGPGCAAVDGPSAVDDRRRDSPYINRFLVVACRHVGRRLCRWLRARALDPIAANLRTPNPNWRWNVRNRDCRSSWVPRTGMSGTLLTYCGSSSQGRSSFHPEIVEELEGWISDGLPVYAAVRPGRCDGEQPIYPAAPDPTIAGRVRLDSSNVRKTSLRRLVSRTTCTDSSESRHQERTWFKQRVPAVARVYLELSYSCDSRRTRFCPETCSRRVHGRGCF